MKPYEEILAAWKEAYSKEQKKQQDSQDLILKFGHNVAAKLEFSQDVYDLYILVGGRLLFTVKLPDWPKDANPIASILGIKPSSCYASLWDVDAEANNSHYAQTCNWNEAVEYVADIIRHYAINVVTFCGYQPPKKMVEAPEVAKLSVWDRVKKQ